MSKIIKNTFEALKLDDSEKEQIFENIWDNKDVHSEKTNMRMNKFMRTAAAVAVITVLGVGTVSGYQYVKKLLSPKKVVQIVTEDNELAKKFGKTSQDVMVQECNGYRVTYLGYVTTKDVKDAKLRQDLNGMLMDGVTNVVFAVEPTEKTKTDFAGKAFSIVPMIKGLVPFQFAQNWMGNANIIDGVYYCVATVNSDWDVFGYDKVYLGVADTSNPVAYYVAKNGEIKRQEQTDTLNALFEVKTDKSKADQEKAKEALIEMNYGDNDPEAIEDEVNTGDVQATEEDFETAISNSELLLEDDELPVDVLGRPIYGTPELGQWSARKNYLEKTGKVDYEWDYNRDENVLHIIAVELRDGKYYQNVYQYKGDAKKDLKWIQSYCDFYPY